MFSDTTREQLKPGVTNAVRSLLAEAITLARTFGEPDLVEEQYKSIMGEKRVDPDLDPMSANFSPTHFEQSEFEKQRKGFDIISAENRDEQKVLDLLEGGEEGEVNLVTGRPIKKVQKRKILRKSGKGGSKKTKKSPPVSHYRGVTWDQNTQTWRSRISIRSKPYELGRFEDETQAAKVYDQIKYKYTKDVSRLNFPEDYK